MNCCPNEQPQVAACIDDLELHWAATPVDWVILQSYRCGSDGGRPKLFWGITFLGRLETKLQIVTKPSHFVSNPFWAVSASLKGFSFTAVGSFSIDDGNGCENVSFKMNSRFFSLWGVYSNLLQMASVGEFPWSWFLEDCTQREKKRFVVACLRPPWHLQLGIFTS